MTIPLVDLPGQYEELRTQIALAVGDVLERHDFILGREVTELEQRMAALCGRRHGVACASGTDALVLSMMSLDIGPGDEVAVPAFTFFATASCVARVGAKPVFCEIDPATFNLDPGKLPRKTKAVVPVDLFGQIADMEHLAPAGLIVEDAAQAVMAERNGRRGGSFGAWSILSFYPTKNLSAGGDAGMLLTDDDALAARARRLRSHGADTTYYHQELGIVSRMATIQAAILLTKLTRLDAWTEQRIAAAAIYDRLFPEHGLTDGRVVTPRVAPGNRHVYHQYTIRVAGGRRDTVRDALKAAGIGSGVYYPLPLHLQPCFAALGGQAGDLPECERASREVLSLPIFPRITRDQQIQVVEAVAKALA